ncbi:mechanosensitive ion channel-like protein [Dysgonomonas alginatilytica]|uniref:Mechanosensitive ion channel-like protein n=1 Tax=Dysgonomonas alginatilytica TaxID=1605892 RepID=A0A2V3PMJ9_9BACT|nr:mechanosensitive ion channel family protein [Dysgonomonas alginatilytica]PXV62794.1 mechanosensitive ion channel-like protein [Dysgonomonas alginatilytica]
MYKKYSISYRFVFLLALLILCCAPAFGQKKKNKKKAVEVVQIDTIQIAKLFPKKAPVVPFRDTIFYIYGNMGSFTSEQRAAAISERIRVLYDDPHFDDDSIKLIDIDDNIKLVYKNDLIVSVDTLQAALGEKTKIALAQFFREKIITSIHKHQEENSLKRIAIQAGWVALILLVIFFLLRGLFFVYRRVKIFIRLQRGKRIKGIFGLIDADREVHLFIFLLKLLRFILIIMSLYLGIWALFKVFPNTTDLSDRLLNYVLSPLKSIARSIIDYLPEFFTILVIMVIFMYIRKSFRFIAQQISSGKITIKGFYPDWATPTYNILNVILYIFMFILIFPYLPKSDSTVFQGVSVFAGIMLSLGSTSIIGNLVAGLVITYMRPFKIGDRIKMDDCLGDVVEKTALVTRVRTLKNEIITIPNSNVMNTKTLNYSASAREYGLILYIHVTVGYDVPWEQVHDLLLTAASHTDNLLKKQKPFILQTALDEFNIEYQLNVYTKEAGKMSAIYSDLRKHVQDVFKEAGINLVSPHFIINKNFDGDKEANQNSVKPQSTKSSDK